MQTKIYVASSWRNELQPVIVTVLRSMGHEVYDFRNPSSGDRGFGWSELDKDWKDWTPEQYRQGLNDPIAVRGFENDFTGMNWANVCLLVLPCGRSAHSEAGYMKGNGKKVFVLMLEKQEPELMYKLFDGVIISVDELRETFKN